MKLFKVECICPSKGKNNLPKYLGDLCADVASIGRYHCQNCSETYEIISDGNGRIFRTIVPRTRLLAVYCKKCEEQHAMKTFLGNFQIDIVNQARFHCKNCNTTIQLNSDGIGGGGIKTTIKTTIVSGMIEYVDNLTVIGD
jgi:transposase-like protein